MTRGQQKIQAQQKAAAKAAKAKKGGHDQKAAAIKALVFTCTVCKVRQRAYALFVLTQGILRNYGSNVKYLVGISREKVISYLLKDQFDVMLTTPL
jgi:hypothetical protein